MRIVYNNFDLGLVTVNSCKTEPVTDPTGRDFLFHRFTFNVSGTINPMYTATGKATNLLPAGGYGVPGDDLGPTIGKLTNILGTPRQSLQIYVGTDLIFSVVSPVEAYDSDLDCGPFPGELNFTENSGDKTMEFTWSITFVVSQCGKYLLSNRWSAAVDIDKHGMSTRTIRGTAIFRKDFLDAEGLSADSFRKWLIMPTSPLTQRFQISVVQNEDGDRLEYTVIDKQVGYAIGNLGSEFGIMTIEGNVTVGVDSQLRDGLIGRVGAIARDLVVKGLGRLGLDEASRGLVAHAMGAGGCSKASAVVRVYAQPYDDTLADTSQKAYMVQCAISIIRDRFKYAVLPGPGGKTLLPILSCYVSQDISSLSGSFIEVRMDWLLINTVALAAIMDPRKIANVMNLSSRFVVLGPTGGKVNLDRFAGTAAAGFEDATPTPELFNSLNTRGGWIGALVAQALKPAACSVPPVPEDPGNVDEPDLLALTAP